MTPELERILTFKSIWALCVIIEGTRKMQATHYACCLVTGRNPLWGVWSLNGRFQGFFAGRQEISDSYPEKAWRRVMARWKLQDDSNSKPDERRKALAKEFRKALPHEHEVQDIETAQVRTQAATVAKAATTGFIRR